MLTIKGKAFTGKSCMMKMAVDASLKNDKVTTLYHFFGGVSEDATRDLLRDLLCQLLDALPYKNKPWEDIRRWGREIAEKQWVDLSSRRRLQDIITRLLIDRKDTLEVFIFVDAIDDIHEASSDDEKPLKILQMLADMLKPKTNLRICISRRHLPDYYVREPPSTTIHLDQYMDQEIGPFIRQELQSIPDHTKVMGVLVELGKSGAHNFRWATSICKDVVNLRSYSQAQLEIVASKVIESHEDLYCSALRSAQAGPSAGSHLHLLLIALGSFRRLTADEFRHAYAFAAKDTFEPESMVAWETSRHGYTADVFPAFLSHATRGLLEIITWTKTSRWATNEQEAAENAHIQHTVSFLHHSTKTFLRSDKGLRELGIESRPELEQRCHLHMFKICGLALQWYTMTGDDGLRLVNYTHEYWLRHAQMCGSRLEEMELPEFMQRCWKNKKDPAKLFIQRQVQQLLDSMDSEIIYLKDDTSMMVLLATLGCTVLLRRHIRTCRRCLRELPDPSSTEEPSARYLEALSNAIDMGQFETATYLLGRLPPKHINVQLEREMTPLYQTCDFNCMAESTREKEQSLDFVCALLDGGACVLENCWYRGPYQVPLHLAIASNNRALVEVLCRGRGPKRLEEMLTVRHEPWGWTALHCAVKFNAERRKPTTNLGTLQALLKCAPKPFKFASLKDDDGKTALQLAQEIHDDAAVRLLERYQVGDEESDEESGEE